MISLLLPTRNRTAEFTRMTDSAFRTAGSLIDVVAYVDDDDPQLEKYKALHDPPKLKILVGPRKTVTQCWNDCIPLASGDIFCQANDDCIMRTDGWAQMVEQAFMEFPDKILMVHGDDLAFGRDHGAAHPFVHRKWVNTVGYFIPPYFSSDYGDTWVNTVADALGRRRFLPFIYEHLHYMTGKAEMDQTTRERLARHELDNPGKLYDELAGRRLEDIAKLRAVIGAQSCTVPKLSIMILTQPSRGVFLKRLMDGLLTQIQNRDDVEIVTQFDDRVSSIGDNREMLRQRTRGEYICFVDDDDKLAPNYIEKIMPLLDGVDYVGFKVQTSIDGKNIPTTTHSLRYNNVGASAKEGNFRDISHLNPMRRELALLVPMSGGFGEDSRWSDVMRGLGKVRTEHFIDEVLYFYESRTQKDDGVIDRGVREVARAAGKEIPTRQRYVGVESELGVCPKCKSRCIAPHPNGVHCLQCGLTYEIVKPGKK